MHKFVILKILFYLIRLNSDNIFYSFFKINIKSSTISFCEDKKMPGVIYIQSIPPLFTVKKLREIMAKFGELGRVYLQAEKRGPKRRKRYTEGWIEFKSKGIAKEVAHRLNGQLVGAASGKRRSAAYDCIWTMKYLHGFKWEHLMDQLAYERRIEQQRLRTEVVQEKRKADHFAHQVEKGERLKKLEEKILKKCGLWERYQMQHQQREVLDEAKKEESRQMNNDEGFLKMIFGENNDQEDKEEEEEMMEEESVDDEGLNDEGGNDEEELIGDEKIDRKKKRKLTNKKGVKKRKKMKSLVGKKSKTK